VNGSHATTTATLLRRDAPGERTTDGVKKSVKRIRDAPNYIIDFASNAGTSDRFCIFISVGANRVTLPPSSKRALSLSLFLFFLFFPSVPASEKP